MTNVLVTALAAEGAASGVSEIMKTAFSTALGQVQTDVYDMMGVALPIGLGIMGVFLAIRLGISFFRSIAH